jgi:hypothetical protein
MIFLKIFNRYLNKFVGNHQLFFFPQTFGIDVQFHVDKIRKRISIIMPRASINNQAKKSKVN